MSGQKKDGLKWEAGKVIVFRACCWDDGWEFDAPLVMYSPVIRYSETGGIGEEQAYAVVEDVLIDLCISGEVHYVHPCDLKEFSWRGWSLSGFKRRKRAIHAEYHVRFIYDNDGERAYEFLPKGSWPAIARHFKQPTP